MKIIMPNGNGFLVIKHMQNLHNQNTNYCIVRRCYRISALVHFIICRHAISLFKYVLAGV